MGKPSNGWRRSVMISTESSMETKKQKIQQQLRRIEQRLRNAGAYVARGENVESSWFLHLRDWEGKSGHPLWMKNFMIPATTRFRSRKEKALERIIAMKKEKRIQRRKHQGGATAWFRSRHTDRRGN